MWLFFFFSLFWPRVGVGQLPISGDEELRIDRVQGRIPGHRQPIRSKRLGKYGCETTARVVTRVIPGAMQIYSWPKRSKMGQSLSASCAASTRVPGKDFGATLFAANAKSNCPRNMSVAKCCCAGLCLLDCHQRLIVCLPRPERVPLDVLETGRDKFFRR
jgi:hypothetical protein